MGTSPLKNFFSRILGKDGQKPTKPAKNAIARNKSDEMLFAALDTWTKNGGYADDATIETIAERMGTTAPVLSEFFTNVLHTRFTTWRKELRIEKAKELLKAHPELSAHKIGAMVGIRDKSNFRTQFREMTGCTPLEWREKFC